MFSPPSPPKKHCQNQNNKTTLAKLTVIFFGWQQCPFQRFCQLMCEVSELWQSLLYFPNILSHTQIKSCLLSASPCYCTLNIRSRDSPSFGDIVLETSSPISIKFSVKMWLKKKQTEGNACWNAVIFPPTSLISLLLTPSILIGLYSFNLK